jgi:hypothetical protein
MEKSRAVIDRRAASSYFRHTFAGTGTSNDASSSGLPPMPQGELFSGMLLTKNH